MPSARTAARAASPGPLFLGQSRGSSATSRSGASEAHLEALQQLLPEPFRIVTEEQRRVRLGRVPITRAQLGGELAVLPADEAGEEPGVVRRLLDDAVDRVGVRRDEEVAEEAQRRRAGVAAHDGEDRVHPLRTAEVDRV